MRTEKDFIGEVTIPEDALYGVHSFRARENFPSRDQFPMEWFRATGTVKLACYRTVRKLLTALQKEHPDVIEQMRIPQEKALGALEAAAVKVASGSLFEHFIVPGT